MTSRVGPSRLLGAVCGLLAAAVAMGIAQLLAGISIPAASPVIAVGSVAINHTPLAVKDWATSTFGTNDKTVLLLGVFVVVFLYAMVVGILAVRRLSAGFAGLALFAIIGAAAALTRHDASAAYALPTIGGALAGAFAPARPLATIAAAAAALREGSIKGAACATGDFALALLFAGAAASLFEPWLFCDLFEPLFPDALFDLAIILLSALLGIGAAFKFSCWSAVQLFIFVFIFAIRSQILQPLPLVQVQ